MVTFTRHIPAARNCAESVAPVDIGVEPPEVGADLPEPSFHHLHINAVDPALSLAWWEAVWPAGEITEVAGFPAFAADGIYHLYTDVDEQAPGGFNPDRHHAVPQSPFWTTGPSTDGLAFYERLTGLDPAGERFRFLPVFTGPEDEDGVPHSGLAPYGDRLLTVAELEALTNRVANGLNAMGFAANDAIAVDMPMTAESVAIYLGIIKMGGVVVSIADSFAAGEIAIRVHIGEAKAIFTQDVITRAGKSLPLYQRVVESDAPPAIVIATATGRSPTVPRRNPIRIAWRSGMHHERLHSPMQLCRAVIPVEHKAA